MENSTNLLFLRKMIDNENALFPALDKGGGI